MFERTDRDQRHPQITYFFQQAMQRGLVNHRTGYKRVAAFFQRDGQAFKPVCPLRGQVACDPDFVAGGVYLRWSHERKYTGWAVLPGSNLSIVWSIVLGVRGNPTCGRGRRPRCGFGREVWRKFAGYDP
jgi:hypothetical protein